MKPFYKKLRAQQGNWARRLQKLPVLYVGPQVLLVLNLFISFPDFINLGFFLHSRVFRFEEHNFYKRTQSILSCGR